MQTKSKPWNITTLTFPESYRAVYSWDTRKCFEKQCFLMFRIFIRNNSESVFTFLFLYWFFITMFLKEMMQSVVCNNINHTVNSKENKGVEEGTPFRVWLCIGHLQWAVTSFLVGPFCSFLRNKWVINYLVSPGRQLKNSSFIKILND